MLLCTKRKLNSVLELSYSHIVCVTNLIWLNAFVSLLSKNLYSARAGVIVGKMRDADMSVLIEMNDVTISPLRST